MDQLTDDALAYAIIDTLKRFAHKMDIDTTAALVLDSLRTYPEYAQIIDSLARVTIETMNNCPTVNEPYELAVVDTSVIKELYITCPVDSLDSLKVISDFKLNKLGGLKISNHGKIDNGERSWED